MSTSTNKPSWSDAPAWANWLAQDRDGWWIWYQNEPYALRGLWHNVYGLTKICAIGGNRSPMWAKTLEQRPEPTKP